MPEHNSRTAAFESYLKNHHIDVNGISQSDGKFHYSGAKNVTFDPGTIPDGTYNIFISNGSDNAWAGVIVPGQNGAYTVKKKDKLLESYDPAKAAAVQEEAPAEKPPKHVQASQSARGYRLSIVRNPHKDTDKEETGRIVITDGDDHIMADCPYISGPSDNAGRASNKGHAPDIDCYTLDTSGGPSGVANPHRDIRKFDPGNGTLVPGLRISDECFVGRSNILIHPELHHLGTLGCFGITDEKDGQTGNIVKPKAQNWEEFEAAWKSIPPQNRPEAMLPINKAEYTKLKNNGQSRAHSLDGSMLAALEQFRNEIATGGSTIPHTPKSTGPIQIS